MLTPGDYYHSTRRATVQPNHSRIYEVFLSDAQASRTKCQFKKREELHHGPRHVHILHGFDTLAFTFRRCWEGNLTIEERTPQMVRPPCLLHQHHDVCILLRDHHGHHRGRHVHQKACARAHPHHPSCHEEERGIVVA